MTLLESAALGLLQGVAEFLPVSSSGHLVVAQRLFGLDEVPLLFDVALHIATLLSVVVVFRKRLAELFISFGRWLVRRSGPEDAANLRYCAAVVVGTVFTAAVGFGMEKFGPKQSIGLIAVCFIATGAILVVSEWIGARFAARGKAGAPDARAGIIVGIAQGIGVLPGLSRSGITIAGSLAAGLSREAAGEFSFLLSIPAILGAFILELKDADSLLRTVDPAALALGMAIAFAAGILALKVLVGMIRRGRLAWFALYLIPLGAACLVWLR
jgi:undecaprenyl-diphosphatase